jgi:hypothetical protein
MKNLSLVLVVLGLTSFAFAKPAAKPAPAPSSSKSSSVFSSPVHESYFAGFEYELQTALSNGGLLSYKQGGSTYTVIEAGVSLSKVIKNNIQAGGEVHLYNSSGGASSSYLEFMGFGVYNFDTDLKQSVYAKAGVGMLNVVGDKGNESKIGFMIGGGKRMLVLEKFTYNPEARITMVDGTTRIEIILLNFSLLF